MSETIEVRYKEIGPNIFHKYIVYTTNVGTPDETSYYARGGPSTGLIVPVPVVGFGYVETEYGLYEEDTADFDDEGDDFSENIISDEDLSEYWKAIQDGMDRINDAKYAYQPTGQNSNATVDDVLKRAGLPEPIFDLSHISPGSRSCGQKIPNESLM